MDAAKNFAVGTLASGINSSATSLSVSTGQGARFPAVPFNAVIWQATDYTSPAAAYFAGHAEIVRVTAISTDTFTIARAQEATSAVNLNTGGKTYNIVAGPTARIWELPAYAEYFEDFTGYAPNAVNQTGSAPLGLSFTQSTLAHVNNYAFGGDYQPGWWISDGRQGVLSISTGTSSTGANGFARTLSSFGNWANWYVGSSNNDRLVFRTAIVTPTVFTSGEDFNCRIGLSKGDGTNYIDFYADRTSGNWVGRSVAGGSSTTRDTGVAIGNGWWNLGIEWRPSLVRFFASQGASPLAQVGSDVTTNVPTNCALGEFATITKSAGTTARGIFIDYLWTRMINNAPRP